MNNPTPSAADTLLRRWKDGTFRELISDWKWIGSYSRRHWKAVTLYTLLGILSTTLGLASGIAGKYAIDVITGFRTDRLATMLLIMAGTALFSLLFDSLTSRLTAKLSLGIHNRIQAEIFERIADADWLSLSAFSSGDILSRFTGDISTVSANAITWLPTVIIGIYRFVSTLLVLLYYDAVMALIAFTSVPVLLLLSRWLLRRQRDHARRVRESSAELMSFESETFSNFDTVKAFGAVPLFGRRLRNAQDDYTREVLDHNRFSILTHVLLSVLNLLVQFAAFGYCLYLLWNDTITYGTMTLFLQQRSSLSSTFDSLLGLIPGFLNSAVSARRIRELTELPREAHSHDIGQPSGPFALELQDLELGYGDDPVVEKACLTAKPGQIVALVGASGAGKTTLLRLILGLLQPKDGHAHLIAADGTRLPLNADTRRQIAYVPQGNSLLSGTVAENLRLAKEDASEQEIIDALKAAWAWEFVEKLPQGIHSRLGERGRGLSEGQAQRIAIARAILRDAPVLLLDEATSALDVATERQVLRSLMASCPGKVCILTTHRPTVLDLCSRVYQVGEGTIRELNPEESAKIVADF